jgi:hypothetical protein
MPANNRTSPSRHDLPCSDGFGPLRAIAPAPPERPGACGPCAGIRWFSPRRVSVPRVNPLCAVNEEPNPHAL